MIDEDWQSKEAKKFWEDSLFTCLTLALAAIAIAFALAIAIALTALVPFSVTLSLYAITTLFCLLAAIAAIGLALAALFHGAYLHYRERMKIAKQQVED